MPKLGLVTWALAAVHLSLMHNNATANATEGQTQIVVQWRYEGEAGLGVLVALQKREFVLAQSCGDLCFVDGHDLGSGTANIFVFANDLEVQSVVSAIVRTYQKGGFPEGMQIGVAQYKDGARRDWTYRPVFPPGLEHFDITYPRGR